MFLSGFTVLPRSTLVSVLPLPVLLLTLASGLLRSAFLTAGVEVRPEPEVLSAGGLTSVRERLTLVLVLPAFVASSRLTVGFTFVLSPLGELTEVEVLAEVFLAS